MIGRYVLATAAVVLLVVGLLLGAVVYLGLHYGEAADSRVRIGTLAEALIPTADGLQLDPARTPADWLQGYAWAMVLDDDGSVIWQHDLPQNLNKHYTASEIASFSRWYLDDWPVFCWTADYGLFVAAFKISLINLVHGAVFIDLQVGITVYAYQFHLPGFPIDDAEHLHIGQGAFFQVAVSGIHAENSYGPVSGASLFKEQEDASD